MRFFPFVISFSILIIVHAVDKNADPLKAVDKSDWIDPSDPTRKLSNFNEVQELLEQNELLRRRIAELGGTGGALIPVNAASACDRPIADEYSLNKGIVIFKHLLRKLSKKMPSPGVYVSEIHFGPRAVTLWKEFLDSSSFETKDLHNIAESISDLFVHIQKEQSKAAEPGYFDTVVDYIRSYLLLLNFCILLPAAALILHHTLRVSKLRLTLWILLLLFLVSIVWTWIRMYKECQAAVHARFVRKSHESGGTGQFCKPDSSWGSWIRGYVGFQQDDQCVEYFKDVMIDCVWTVTPLKAVSITVTEFFVAPLASIGKGIASFWTGLLKNLPLTAYPIVLPAVTFFTVFFLLVICGYRFRFGYGLVTLEPGPPRVIVANQQQNAIQYRPADNNQPRNRQGTIHARRRGSIG